MKKYFALICILIISMIGVSIYLFIFSDPVQEDYKLIRILPDGTLSPKTNSIHKDGSTYTFSSDFYGQIIVDTSNIIIDGAGHTLHGKYNGTRTDAWVVGQGPVQNASAIPWTIGIDLAREECSNLTVRNLKIKNFYIATYLWTSNNIIINNTFGDSIVGILLSGDSNTLIRNYISNNEEGIFFGVNTPGNDPLNIIMNLNSFVENDIQFSGCFCEESNTDEAIHTWDNGKQGNYWSDYNGKDENNDGIGDTPYIIDSLNQDRYPLMEPIANEE